MKTVTVNLKPAFLILFSLFSCSLLLHIGHSSWSYQKTVAIIIIFICLQIINYKLWWATLLSIIAFFIIYLPKFPRIANHANIEIFISILLFIAVSLKYKGISSKYLASNVISLIFRYTLITIYFIAGFHKLNYGFFSLEGSCAAHINQSLTTAIFGNNYIISDTVLRFFQVTTILLEMVVPFGLLFYKTRKTTVWILVFFHFYLSLCGFSNFSALAGFLLVGSIINFSNNTANLQFIKPLRYYLIFCVLSCVSSYTMSRFSIFTDYHIIQFFHGIIFNIGWIILFSQLLKRTDHRLTENVSFIAPIFTSFIAFLWGMQGYLGLSSAGNLSMFSNLITEKTRNNHLIIDTNKTKIWNFEEDYVTILEIDPNLKWEGLQTLKGYDLPLTEFKVQIAKWIETEPGAIKCTLLYNNKILEIPDLKVSGFAQAEWWHKYILYRRIPSNLTNECMW